jgi:uncharacterized membrane protein YdfJ with MMPL/SSD domain
VITAAGVVLAATFAAAQLPSVELTVAGTVVVGRRRVDFPVRQQPSIPSADGMPGHASVPADRVQPTRCRS